MPGQRLVERESQLKVLRAAFADAERHHGRMVILSGEPGAGKSALALKLVSEVADRARVVRAACQDTATPIPLGVLRDAARQLGGELAATLGHDVARHDLFDLALRQIDHSRRPMVWVVDDAQWADEASLDLIRFIARRLLGLPLLLILTYRDTEVDPLLRSLLGELATAPDVRRVRVPPLSEAAVSELATSLDATSVARLHARTGGNAFFVTELLRDPAVSDGGVVDLIRSRVERLSRPARELLDVLTVLGDPCPVALASALGGSLDAVDELNGAGLVVSRESGSLGFRHDLVREAHLSVLSPQRSVVLHRLALAALGDDADPSVAVTHAIGAGDRAAKARWAPAAAEASTAAGNVRQSARLLGLAAAAVIDDDSKARFLARQGLMLAEANEFDDALAVLQAAQVARCGASARAEVWASFARTYSRRLQGDECDRCVVLAIAAAEELPIDERPILPYTVAAGQAMLRRDQPTAERYGLLALELAERRGDFAQAADIRVTLGSVAASNDPSQRQLREAIAYAERVGAYYVMVKGLNNAASSLVAHSLLTEALEVIERVVVLSAERDYDDLLGRLQVTRSSVLLELGRYDECIAALKPLLDDPRHAWRGGLPGILAVALARTGRLRDRSLIEQELRVGREAGDTVIRIMGRVSAAEIAWLGDELTTEFDDLVDLHASLPQSQHFRDMVAGWCRMLGGPPLAVGKSGDVFALAARDDFVAAARRFAERGMRYHQALCLYRVGETAMLNDALDIALQLGALPLAGKIKAALREQGVTASRRRGAGRARTTNPAGLTGREVDVLRLVADGLRNADIAQRLVLSPRTVDHHVSNVLGKLGVQSRAAAARAAHALGLVEQM